MKTILLVPMVCLCSVSVAQHMSVNKDICDSGNTISIKVNGMIDGKRIGYANTFNSEHLNKKEREMLISRVLDSLGVGNLIVPVVKLKNEGFQIVAKNDSERVVAARNTTGGDIAKSYVVAGTHPYTKEIKYNRKSGMLFMRYRLTKNDEEHIYEKNVNANAESEQQREEIIKQYEKEIGLPGTEK